MNEITKPIMLDETGQAIVEALRALAANGTGTGGASSPDITALANRVTALENTVGDVSAILDEINGEAA